jgi:iron complex transport system permease protein
MGRSQRRVPLIPTVAVLAAALLVSLVFATGFGAASISAGEVYDVLLTHILGSATESAHDSIVWGIRVPRVLLGALVGAGLALAGTVIQTLVRYPLADPYLLGISSGASVGATAVITTGFLSFVGVWALPFGALTGALAAAVLVFGVAMAQGGLTPIRLVLTGTVLSSAFSAMASFLVFRSQDPQAAQSVLFWLLGSLAGASWNQVPMAASAILPIGVVLVFGHGWLDALAAGPDVAATLGVRVRTIRVAVFVLQAILVGTVVAVAGGIGFVGLIVPHIARLLVGPLHRAVLPVAALLGGLFLIWVDVAARTVAIPREVPLSVVTGLVGAPVFLYLLGRRRYAFGGGAS